MKVIVKSNDFIAVSTKRKSDCLYQLGQYLNKETCEIEMDGEKIKSITCTRTHENGWSTNIRLTADDLHYDERYIILDKEGNLVNVVGKEQFEKEYAILADT